MNGTGINHGLTHVWPIGPAIDVILLCNMVLDMTSLLSRLPEVANATPDEQLAMIDELWELVRRSDRISIPESHLGELERRVSTVLADPSIALSPAEARALLRK